jgi:hypothetical protein
MSNFEKFMHFFALYLAAAGCKDWCILNEARGLRTSFPDLTLEPIDCEQRAWDVFQWMYTNEGRVGKPSWLD